MEFFEAKREALRCLACKHYCVIPKGGYGLCGARKNTGKEIVSIAHAKPSGIHLDPIEKKPLYHYFPGTTTLSMGFFGCNFSCAFCQNYEISCARGAGLEKLAERLETVSPEMFAEKAAGAGAKSVALTYNEPAINIEYALESFGAAKAKGLGTVFVSNGYSSKEAMKEMKGKLDAINIDLKAFTEKFYRELCGAKLENVLETIKAFHRAGTWLELTTLVIPKKNDSKEELSELTRFIASVSKDIPWHIIAFFPIHKMSNHPAAQAEHVERAVEAGKEAGLKHIYSRLPGGENTYCPKCGKPVIERSFYGSAKVMLENGKCGCGKEIKGMFE